MNVRWVSQFACTPPPSASIQKVAMFARAQKATEEMGLIVLVRVCVLRRVGRGRPQRIVECSGCGGPRKGRLCLGDIHVKTKRSCVTCSNGHLSLRGA